MPINYTRDIPTENGFYWICQCDAVGNPIGEPEMVLVSSKAYTPAKFIDEWDMRGYNADGPPWNSFNDAKSWGIHYLFHGPLRPPSTEERS